MLLSIRNQTIVYFYFEMLSLLTFQLYSVVQYKRLPMRGGMRGLQSGSEGVASPTLGWQGHGGAGGYGVAVLCTLPRVKYPKSGLAIQTLSHMH